MHGNGVDDRHASWCQAVAYLVKKHRKAAWSDMLQHPDRHDPVECPGLVPVITKRECQAVTKAGIFGSLPCVRELLFGQGDAGDRDILPADRQRARQPTPAAADIQHAVAILQVQLRGKSCQLGHLCLIETVIRAMEIGTGILPPGVKEAGKQLVCQIVMMRHIAS